MKRTDFIANVKIGSCIKDNFDTFRCVDIPIEGFWYDFENINSDSNTVTFSLLGVTDGSVKEYTLVK